MLNKNNNNPNHTEMNSNLRIPLAFEEWLTVIVMALLALITFANVLVRYFTDQSFAWTEEISIFLMIVLALVAGSAAFVRNAHIHIEFFVQRLSNHKQLFLAQLSALLCCTFFGVLTILSARLVWDDYRYEEVSPGIGVPQWWYTVWLPALSMVIAPWREWDLLSRQKLLAYAEAAGIPVDMKHKQGGAPYSMDANLLHISFEGRHLEDPKAEAEKTMWRWTVSPENAPDNPEFIELEYENGDPVAINGERLSPAEMLARLNEIGGRNGIGRLDLVENRYVGMKSRGCYETPGGTIMLKGHRAIESITLDREVAHLKDDLMPRYAALIYNGYWWSPERRALQTLIDFTQTHVNGWVKLKLYKGSVSTVARDSKDSLFDQTIATFDDDGGAYNQACLATITLSA